MAQVKYDGGVRQIDERIIEKKDWTGLGMDEPRLVVRHGETADVSEAVAEYLVQNEPGFSRVTSSEVAKPNVPEPLKKV